MLRWGAMMVRNSVSLLEYTHNPFSQIHFPKILWVYAETKNKQQTERVRKKIISIFKNMDFKTEIVTNLTEVDFLDVTFNLENNTYRPYKKPNGKLIYIDVSSNRPPQIEK